MSDLDAFARGLDGSLWEGSLAFAAHLEHDASQRLAAVGHSLGGGGAYHLFYFLTRLLRPKTTLETGVAAGYSSHAFLAALERNGAGHLYSSDFPYFRLPQPERFIGILVPDELRARWTLRIAGDAANRPPLIAAVEQIDLFHYDSDKSYSGRRFAASVAQSKLAANGVMLFDDIQNNAHFHDLVAATATASATVGATGPAFRVFEFGGRYIGLLGRVEPAVDACSEKQIN